MKIRTMVEKESTWAELKAFSEDVNLIMQNRQKIG